MIPSGGMAGPYRTREEVRLALESLDPRALWSNDQIQSAHTLLVEIRAAIHYGALDAGLDEVARDLELSRVAIVTYDARRRAWLGQLTAIAAVAVSAIIGAYGKGAITAALMLFVVCIKGTQEWGRAAQRETIERSLTETIAAARSRPMTRALPAPAVPFDIPGQTTQDPVKVKS